MSRKNLSNLNILLLLSGIVIGLILAAGLGFTGDISANPPALEESASGNTEPDTDPDVGAGSTTALNALGNAFADVAEKVNPAVVTISTETVVSGRQRSPFSGSPFEDFFRRMYPQEGFKQQGLGSGVLVQSDGIILTNNHVIENADDIVVRLIDGREFAAEVKGRDPRTDLAVISIDASSLPSVNLGNSDEIRVGQWVLAVGSPLGEQFAHTVTAGIVSAKGRTGVGLTQYEDFIQTDAAINPGNSGGALVNLKGELVGINTAIASRSGGNIGIGFAVPANLAKKVMNDILSKGKVVRGWLGVGIRDLTSEIADMYELQSTDGILIREVFADGPAESAGIEAGDIVVEVSGRKVRNTTELSTLIGSTEPGTSLKLTVIRDGNKKNVSVTLAEYPEDGAQFASVENRSVESLGMQVETLANQHRSQYNLRSRDQGVVITALASGSIGTRAGLQEGDLIAKINRVSVSNVQEFNNVMQQLKASDPVVFFIKRNNRKLVIDFVIPEN